MKKKSSDFDEFFIATVLADLFDSSCSEDPDFVAQKIIDGLEENDLLHKKRFDNDEPIAA